MIRRLAMLSVFLALPLLAGLGCTYVNVPGVGTYGRFMTDFDADVVQTSVTLGVGPDAVTTTTTTLRVGSHLNKEAIQTGQYVISLAPGVK